MIAYMFAAYHLSRVELTRLTKMLATIYSPLMRILAALKKYSSTTNKGVYDLICRQVGHWRDAMGQHPKGYGI